MEHPPDDREQWQFPPPQPNTSYPPQQPDTSYPLHQPNPTNPLHQSDPYPNQLPPPQAPLPPPPKKANGCLIVTVVVVAIIVALFICGAIGSSFVTRTASSPDATATADANNVVAVTDTPQPTDTPVPTDTATSTAVVSSYTPPPTQAPAKWTTTHKYTGSGIKKTAIFTVPDDWKITWSCTPSSFYGNQYNVQVYVYNSDGTPADVAINEICQSGNTNGETEEHQGGDVYLEINSEGSWNIQVQELQ